MKFLVFSDIHGNKSYVKKLVKRAKEKDIDFVLCPGDFTEFGTGFNYVVEAFDAIGKTCYWLPGNHEGNDLLVEKLGRFKHAVNIHKKVVELGDWVMLGYGEDGFSEKDPAFRKQAREWYSKYNGKKIILVTHGPAWGTKLDFIHEKHVGNRDYRDFIERCKVKLAICGHLHETAGMKIKVDNTSYVNAGWDGVVIEL